MELEHGSIDRQFYVEATPQVVFEVISTPEHIRQWWPDDASLDRTVGGTGELVWNQHGQDGPTVVPLTVVELDPPRRFAFRWAYEPGRVADATSSFLVTFDLAATGTGTTVTFRETGFRERGWEVAVLEDAYRDHVAGWARFLPRLVEHAQRAGAAAR